MANTTTKFYPECTAKEAILLAEKDYPNKVISTEENIQPHGSGYIVTVQIISDELLEAYKELDQFFENRKKND